MNSSMTAKWTRIVNRDGVLVYRVVIRLRSTREVVAIGEAKDKRQLRRMYRGHI